MPRRPLFTPGVRAMAAACCVAALVACPAGYGTRVPLAEGDTIADVGVSGSRPALVWVFNAEECLGCNLTDPARSVRALQRRLGNRLETVVVAVSALGAEDQAMVGRFLESQRISAQVEVQSPAEHEQDFGAGPIPAFYLVGRYKVVAAVLAPPPEDSWHLGRDSLSTGELVQHLAENWATDETRH